MRLLRFYIRKHLLLQDLDLRFDRPGRLNTGQYALDFLVGVNGSGKSTVLRALTQAFSNLSTDQPNSFDFELEYLLGDGDSTQRVTIRRITNDGVVKQTMTVKSGDEDVYPESKAIDTRYLPRRVIVHSTGNEDEWSRLLNRRQEEPGTEDASKDALVDAVQRAIIELPGSMAKSGNADSPDGIPPFWLMRIRSFPVITLCGLLIHLASDKQPLREVINALQIQSITGFSLRFRLHSTLSPLDEYKRLSKFASRQLSQGTDYLLHFDLSISADLAAQLLEEFGGSFELYRVLERISHPDETGQPTLQQVSIFLQRMSQPASDDEQMELNTVPNLFLLDWLSDGEQSFLGRMALLSILDTSDSLILLDEPEVHFNDYWKREIVSLLDVVMSNHTNHLLITTHSSILLSDVTEDHIVPLMKNKQGYVEYLPFVSPTFGTDPSSIMIHLFDTGSAVGSFSAKYLADAIERNNPKELNELLEKVGLGYWYFRLQNRLEGRKDAPQN